MLDYARNDSHYLIAIYVMLVKLLNPNAFEKEKSFSLPHLPFAVKELAEKDVNPWLDNIKDIMSSENGEATEIFNEALR